jgi:hypothetical protein
VLISGQGGQHADGASQGPGNLLPLETQLLSGDESASRVAGGQCFRHEGQIGGDGLGVVSGCAEGVGLPGADARGM